MTDPNPSEALAAAEKSQRKSRRAIYEKAIALEAVNSSWQRVTDYARCSSDSGPGDLQAYIESLWQEKVALEAENRELRGWKDSALKIFDNLRLQEIGKSLEIRLGEDISAQILPEINKLKAENQRLREDLEGSNRRIFSQAAFRKVMGQRDDAERERDRLQGRIEQLEKEREHCKKYHMSAGD